MRLHDFFPSDWGGVTRSDGGAGSSEEARGGLTPPPSAGSARPAPTVRDGTVTPEIQAWAEQVHAGWDAEPKPADLDAAYNRLMNDALHAAYNQVLNKQASERLETVYNAWDEIHRGDDRLRDMGDPMWAEHNFPFSEHANCSPSRADAMLRTRYLSKLELAGFMASSVVLGAAGALLVMLVWRLL